jgi:hypothetical protein
MAQESSDKQLNKKRFALDTPFRMIIFVVREAQRYIMQQAL